MIIPHEIIEEIKYRNDIETVIGSYVNLKRSGANAKGLCPFHSEKTPSFHVYIGNQSFYCFGCGASGDVITFTMKTENLDYISAIRVLASRSGITLPEGTERSSSNEVGRQRILEMNKAAAKFFHNCLFDEELGKAGRDYIIKNRGLAPSVIKHFGIGYAPNDFGALHRHLKSLGFTDEEMITGFLCARSKKNNSVYDVYRERVMFPIIDVTGNVIAFGGRRIDGVKENKYINTNDTPAFKKSKNLFALNFAKNNASDFMILCEGYMDVVALHAAGYENAVATLGTAITPDQARMFARYTKKVIISYDNDEPGQVAANKAFKLLQEVGIDVRILKSDGEGVKDPDEYIKKYGKERFSALLNNSKTKFEFEQDRILSGYNLNNMDEKVKALKELCQAISNYPSEIERELYAKKIATQFDIAVESVNRDINNIIKRRNSAQKKKESADIYRKTSMIGDRINRESASNVNGNKIEEAILGMMMQFPEHLETCVNQLSADDFVTSFSKRIFECICDVYKECKKFDIGYIQNDFTVDEISRISKMIIERQQLSLNDDKTLQDLINSLKGFTKKKEDATSLDSILRTINNKKHK